jgi:zinc and cadmium transporter
MTLIYILIATFLISAIAFIGALTLFLKQELLNKVLLILVSFSAGALIGGAFLHLIPEAIIKVGIAEGEILKVFLYLIFGFAVFFILEQFISWHHHHDCVDCEKVAPFSYLVLISDGFHNFIDGFIIAASFIISLPVGLVASLAVGLHEIPQEIGDFGVLVYGGMKKGKALLLNFLSGFVAVLGGIAGFFLSERIGDSIVFLLPFAAGNFIYIAASDLIPEIKNNKTSQNSVTCFFLFLLGIILMLLLKLIA